MGTPAKGHPDAISALGALADPARRRVYRVVSTSRDAVGRDHVAEALELPRSTAAFHLDRLVEAGLLTTESRRLTGRTGPGAGRPAKLYRRAEHEVGLSLPSRLYELGGRVMAEAIARAAEGVPVREALHEAAERAGRGLAGASDDLGTALDAAGFEPHDDGESGVTLGTCPFHRLALENPAVVCDLNHALVCGMARSTGADPARVLLDPGAGSCCIRVVAAPN
ncbi:helix-turn-helix transcriptional regulator [Agromyces italicus]|uniref:helix-turn-helix transcriptional regulator n=1 Tax=Agromyces italicus TaxID=279572 RepID=UPI0003B35453|nr:helix-turn-helix domain-containing protein [Agromyces italicus]